MPHTGEYARGIRADTELDFGQARQHYATAHDEFRRAGHTQWADKTSRQLSYSMMLERAEIFAKGVASNGYIGSGQWRLQYAVLYHEKFLSTRAFLGHPVPELSTRAETMYRQILDNEPENVPARLDLAALYAEMGQSLQAETEFRRVPESRRVDDTYAIELARYYASRGQIDEAFQALERARRRLTYELREIAFTNSFDRLRKDPRFLRLVGSVPPPTPRSYGCWPLPTRP